MTSAPIVHIHTQADKTTVAFAQHMWNVAKDLAIRPENLRLTVHCMGQSAVEKATLWTDSGNVRLVPGGKDPLNGSTGHGACAMDSIAMTGDGAIHVICDADTVLLARGWDDYLRIKLINQGVALMGSTYEEIGGFSSGTSKTQTYKGVPSLTWVAMSPLHDWRDLSVMPDKNHIIEITDETLALIYGLPVGYSVFGEVGWQIPSYVWNKKFRCEGWRQLKPTRTAAVLRGLTDYHEEFHAGDVPFVAHHRGSIRHTYRGDKTSRMFYDVVDSYVSNERNRAPRWTWDNQMPVVSLTMHENERAATMKLPTQPKASNEWVKISMNGAAVLPRSTVTNDARNLSCLFKQPENGSIAHVRIEGELSSSVTVRLPSIRKEPYVSLVRNATHTDVIVVCDASPNGRQFELRAGQTSWLLMDADGPSKID